MRATINGLTGIRGIAALWVALHHALGTLPLETGLPIAIGNAIQCGWIAVDLFFILSGYIMCHVHLEDLRLLSWSSTWHFWKLRLARIYPAHLTMTLAWLPALLLAMVSLPGALTPAVREQFSGTALICALTLSNGWGLPNSQGWNSVSWSVGSEWFAYLTFPLAAVLLNRVHTTRAALLLAGSSLGVPLALSIAINGGEHYMLPWNWTIVRVETAFLLGCSVFQIAKRPYPNIVANCLLAASLVVIVWIVARGAPGLEIGALLLSFALLIASLAKSGSVGDAIFGGRPLIFLGRISYSIYLSHALVLVLFKQVLERTVHVAGPLVSTLILTAYLTAVVAAGYLLFAAIENPARRILRRIWIGGADEVVIAPATAG